MTTNIFQEYQHLQELFSDFKKNPKKLNEQYREIIEKDLKIEKKENNTFTEEKLEQEKQKILNQYHYAYFCFIHGDDDTKTLAIKQFRTLFKHPDKLSILLIDKKKLNEKIIYNPYLQVWYMYELNNKKFVWVRTSMDDIRALVLDEIKNLVPDDDILQPTTKKISALDEILGHLKRFLKQDTALIRNKNITVYGTTPIEFLNHKPKIKEDCKPLDYVFNYNPIIWDEKAKCPQIKEWLLKKFNNNPNKLNLFLAICALIVRSNADPFNLQIFVEIHGAPKAGKSLLGRLLQAIAGPEGFCASNMEKISKNFELDKLFGKNLCIMPDQETFAGNIETFKALTGCDTVTARPIYSPSFDFRFFGIIVIITNHKIYWGGTVESAIARRKISLEFPETINEKLNTQLLDFDKSTGEPIGQWKNDLPGFIQWIYKFTPEQIKTIILNETSKNERTPEPNTISSYVKNALFPAKSGMIGVTTSTFGPPLATEIEKYQRKTGRQFISSAVNAVHNIQQEFPLQWPNHTIEIIETNQGPILKGVIYQNVLSKEHWKLMRSLFQYYYDKNFFGERVFIQHEPLTLLINKPDEPRDNLILSNEEKKKKKMEYETNLALHNLYKHLSQITKENDPSKISEKLLEFLGTPIVKNKNKYDYELIQNFKKEQLNTSFEHMDHELIRLSDSDQKKILEKFIFECYVPHENHKIPTKKLLYHFEYYLMKQNFQLNNPITEKKFKVQIKEAFSNVYPEAKPLLNVANITPNKVKGLQGLILKEEI